MSKINQGLALSIFSWAGDRPSPLPFPEHDKNYADIDLSADEVYDLIYQLMLAQIKEEQVSIRIANDDDDLDFSFGTPF